MGFASTASSKAPTQPNFNLTRIVRDVNNSTHRATTCINDPSYNAIDAKTEIPKRNDPSNRRLTDAHRALNPEDPLSVIYGGILSTLKMQNVALVPLKPFDGKHLNYKNFKKEFFAMYHNRIDDVVVRFTEFGLANPMVDLNFDELPIEKTLGVLWENNFDAFLLQFKLDDEF